MEESPDTRDAPSGGARGEEIALPDLEPDVVEDVYRRLLVPAFRPEELMTLAEMREAYGPSGTDPSVVVLSGGSPVAVMLGEWYAQHRVLLLSYLSVDRAARGSGIGARLVRESLPRWCGQEEPVLVLAEVDDPRAWPGDDEAGDPHRRLHFYGRHGARLLPLRYFQPSLRPDSSRVPGMLLLRLDRSNDVPSWLLAAFLEEYFTACEGPTSLTDPPVRELLAAAGGLDLELDVWPVARWPDVPAP